ncbi:MAG: hypothetical protein WCI05_02245 [Myxococcales bacterium]
MIFIGLAAFGAACSSSSGSTGDGGASDTGADVVVRREGILFGRLAEAGGTTVIGDATLSAAGVEAKTNNQGFFALKALPSGQEVMLKVTATGYAPAVKFVTIPSEGSSFVQLSMLKWGATTTFDVTVGGSISFGGASVTIPANAIDATGQVRINLGTLDASDPGQLSGFPGNFRTNAGGLLESFGAIVVEALDAAGNVVNLRAGQNAAAVIPVTSLSTTIPLWRFDTTAGTWTAQGTLTCTGGSCSSSIPSLGWWNADQVMETTCLQVCAQNSSGRTAAGVSLEAQGADYNGTSYGSTGLDGCACLNVKRNANVQIYAITSGGRVGPVAKATASNNLQCSAGATSCDKVTPNLVVETPKFQGILTWTSTPRDLDSHFTGPCPAPGDAGDNSCTGRFHIYFSSRGILTQSPFAYLDTDETGGYGPEITSLGRCTSGIYRYFIRRYSSDGPIESSLAQTRILLPNNNVVEKSVPTVNPTDQRNWIVGELTCTSDNCDCTWRDIDTFVDDTSAEAAP